MAAAKLPRDSAGSFELHGGTGPILAMVPLDHFMEVYKVDARFRCTTPDGVDPKRTNPNALWVNVHLDDVGTRNPIIARVLLQADELVKVGACADQLDRTTFMKRINSCKESLIVCERVLKRIESSYDEIVQRIKTQGVSMDKRGRGLSGLPQIPELDANVSLFLSHGKKALAEISKLPSVRFPIPAKDSNFEFLLKRLEPILPADNDLVAMIRQCAPMVKRIIDLRNGLEHPHGATATTVTNFHLAPDNSIHAPDWRIGDDQTQPVVQEMRVAYQFLIDVAEAMIVLLIKNSLSAKFPWILIEKSEDQVNEDIPTRFGITIDTVKLGLPQG